MSKYEGLEQELKSIDVGELTLAFNFLFDRSMDSSEEMETVTNSLEEYPALSALRAEMLDTYRSAYSDMTKGEHRALEVGVTLSLAALRELVVNDDLPPVES